MATPHISAELGDFAKTVLMPGDPLRAKYVAETFLENVKCVNTVRNVLGYTGTYKGKPISVMASGMGIPSTCIYATELYNDFDVEEIIRVGSCGSVQDEINLGDIVVGMAASTDSAVNRQRFNGWDFAASADYGLLAKVMKTAELRQQKVVAGNIFSADLFYTPNFEVFSIMEKLGIVGVEMEAAGLYGVAAELGKKALTVLTVSDHIKTGEKMTAQARQNTFADMMVLTLESVV